jgi:hypothetical protein
VEVQEGRNKNFRFDGIGSVMTEIAPYGGLVYGYNDVEATVGVWIPHPDKVKRGEAAVFLIGMDWGWGFKQQMTNNVTIIISSVAMTGNIYRVLVKVWNPMYRYGILLDLVIDCT